MAELILEKVRSFMISEDSEALKNVSSSLRTTLESKMKSCDFSSLLNSGAVKQNYEAKELIPERFATKHKDSVVVALRYVYIY